jgi:hypothetical protein
MQYAHGRNHPAAAHRAQAQELTEVTGSGLQCAYSFEKLKNDRSKEFRRLDDFIIELMMPSRVRK